MRCALGVVTLVGCGASSAMEIIVEPEGASVDEVRLYVGLGDPQNMPHDIADVLVPPSYPRSGPPPRGFWWESDVREDRRIAVPNNTTEVRFTFQPGPRDEKLTIVVVGYADGVVSAAGVLEGAFLESGMVRQYVVTLEPASPRFTPNRRETTVQEWQVDDKHACAHYATGRDSIYIGPLEDRDCDGFEDDDTKECRDGVFQGYVRAKRDALSCGRGEPLGNGEVTVLGGQGCIDGRGREACQFSSVCIDSRFAACRSGFTITPSGTPAEGDMTAIVSARFQNGRGLALPVSAVVSPNGCMLGAAQLHRHATCDDGHEPRARALHAASVPSAAGGAATATRSLSAGTRASSASPSSSSSTATSSSSSSSSSS